MQSVNTNSLYPLTYISWKKKPINKLKEKNVKRVQKISRQRSFV